MFKKSLKKLSKYAIGLTTLVLIYNLWILFSLLPPQSPISKDSVLAMEMAYNIDHATTETQSADIDEALDPLSTPNSLASKDTSGTFEEKENESEIIEERTRSFKKFSQGDNKYRVGGQIGPVHYKEDPFSETETYKEIDLTIKEANGLESYDYKMDNNGYQAYFWNEKKTNGDKIKYVARYERAGKWLEMAPVELIYENNKGERQEISQPQDAGAPEINNDEYTITWKNAFGKDIDFRYNVAPDHFFKTVIVNNKEALPEPTIDKDGLKLTVVMSIAWDDEAKPANNFAPDSFTNLASYREPSPLDEESQIPMRYRPDRYCLCYAQLI